LTDSFPEFHRGQKVQDFNTLLNAITFVSPSFRIPAIHPKSKTNLLCADNYPMSFPTWRSSILRTSGEKFAKLIPNMAENENWESKNK